MKAATLQKVGNEVGLAQLSSWIAGLRYRGPDGTKRGKYCLGLREGDRLDLVPEPENRHDQNAVAIKHNGCHLGYVPSRQQWVWETISKGHRLSCAVTRLETEGWLFRRVSFVGVRITVESEGKANARDTVATRTVDERVRAWQACIDGLRVLAYMAMVDDMASPEEFNIEMSYIESRLTIVGINHDATLTDAMLAISQGLVVSKRSLSRAINIVAADREYFKLVLDAVLRIFNLGSDPKGLQRDVLERISKAGKAKGWI